ncbi:MAG: DUF4199 domain-containing protein [Bacteroidota bacterium]
MQKTIIKNGLISAGILLGVNLVTFLLLGTDPDNYEIGEIIGYATIVGCMAMVFIGMREYEMMYEKLSFTKKIGIGSGIALCPSLAFGLYNVIYYKWMDPDFMESYYTLSLKQMEETMSPEEFQIAKAQALEQMAMFESLWFQFILMFLTVFVIGLIVSLLSAMYLQIRPVRK